MFCTSCGTKLRDTARFCTACGKPVDQPGDVGLKQNAPAREAAPTRPAEQERVPAPEARAIPPADDAAASVTSSEQFPEEERADDAMRRDIASVVNEKSAGSPLSGLRVAEARAAAAAAASGDVATAHGSEATADKAEATHQEPAERPGAMPGGAQRIREEAWTTTAKADEARQSKAEGRAATAVLDRAESAPQAPSAEAGERTSAPQSHAAAPQPQATAPKQRATAQKQRAAGYKPKKGGRAGKTVTIVIASLLELAVLAVIALTVFDFNIGIEFLQSVIDTVRGWDIPLAYQIAVFADLVIIETAILIILRISRKAKVS